MEQIVQDLYWYQDEDGNKIYDKEEILREFMEKLDGIGGKLIMVKTKTFRVLASETHIYSQWVQAKDEAQAKSLFMEMVQAGLESDDTDHFQIDFVEEVV
jgi:hypothetical protein